MFHYAATNCKLDGNWKISADVIHFLALLACCQSFLGFLARHLIFFKPVKNGSYPPKWRAWRVLAKALCTRACVETTCLRILWHLRASRQSQRCGGNFLDGLLIQAVTYTVFKDYNLIGRWCESIWSHMLWHSFSNLWKKKLFAGHALSLFTEGNTSKLHTTWRIEAT